jgi:hypothetical protein
MENKQTIKEKLDNMRPPLTARIKKGIKDKKLKK